MNAVFCDLRIPLSLGLDPKLLAGILSTATGRCWSVDTYNPVPGVMENVPSSNDYKVRKTDCSLRLSARHSNTESYSNYAAMECIVVAKNIASLKKTGPFYGRVVLVPHLW